MTLAALNRAPELGKEAVDEQGVAASVPTSGAAVNENDKLDFFKQEHGMSFAGRHLILDLWEASGLDDAEHIEQSLRAAAIEAGATILSSDFHVFQPNGGVTGVLVLSESHISIHTWPERGYAALDVFMCGDAEPHKAITVLQRAFSAGRVGLTEHKRGLTP